jgi:chemotaxis protein MotB
MRIMATSKTPPIIIIKKVVGHGGGHNGGAWKVAYADFVTALMSLFIVLWLMGSSEQVKKAVAGYFNDPKGTGKLLGTQMSGTGDATTAVDPTGQLEKLKEKIEQAIKANKDLEKLSKQIEITITSEGLRIELLEGKDGTFYEIGSPKLNTNGQELLTLLAAELKTLPNTLLIEGYTDATPYSGNIATGYSNWDLSADRANSARRLLQQNGVRPNQVSQVRGYADQMLRVKDKPTDPSNRRVSILVKNDSAPVPTLSAASVVNGTTPLPGTEKAQVAAKKQTKPQSAPPVAKPLSTPLAAKPTAPAVPIKPKATAKISVMDKLKGLMHGSKK